MHRYGQQLEQRMDAIRASSEAARYIVSNFEDKDDDLGASLIALIQSELFESVMAFARASDSDILPEERVKMLSQEGGNIGALARDGVHHKRFRAEVEKVLLARQSAAHDALQRKGGVTAETGAAIRESLGIKTGRAQ